MPSSSRIILLGAILASSTAMADNCISLSGSTMCPAFNASSISLNASVVALYPFLSYVTSTSSFDSAFASYLNSTYPRIKYQDLLGCSSFNGSNTTDLYARYTASTICNAMIQNSVESCSLTGQAADALCADSCAQFALSEQDITASSQLCGMPNDNALNLIRADFTNCALPADSLQQSCITGAANEPDNCGFSNNMAGLCSYCSASSPNSTDSCCLFSGAGSKCKDVKLPITTSVPPLFTSTSASSAPTATASTTNARHAGLSGGAIAGIVVGSVLGALLLLAIVIGCCILLRRRHGSRSGSVLNQPSPPRGGSPRQMAYADGVQESHGGFVPGGRVARMAALEDNRHDEEALAQTPSTATQPPKRSGSLSSDSAFAAAARRNDLSDEPSSGAENYSSPEGVGSGQSEQLTFFKDYYSQDEIHPGDQVAVLWAYQPRANDEFELERGEMLKVVGIWDDGWATGVRLNERAEDWEEGRNPNRDSGMSNGRTSQGSGSPSGEIKAFPLVCVCMPRHWRKTIEADSGDGLGPPENPEPRPTT